MPRKIDYQNECLRYLKLLETGEKIKQADFCERRSGELDGTVYLSSFKRHLRDFGGKKGIKVSVSKKRSDLVSDYGIKKNTLEQTGEGVGEGKRELFREVMEISGRLSVIHVEVARLQSELINLANAISSKDEKCR